MASENKEAAPPLCLTVIRHRGGARQDFGAAPCHQKTTFSHSKPDSLTQSLRLIMGYMGVSFWFPLMPLEQPERAPSKKGARHMEPQIEMGFHLASSKPPTSVGPPTCLPAPTAASMSLGQKTKRADRQVNTPLVLCRIFLITVPTNPNL